MELALCNLNVERDRHNDVNWSFLHNFAKEHQYFVLCFQELHEQYYQEIRNELQLNGAFVPSTVYSGAEVSHDAPIVEGNALLTNAPLVSLASHWYRRAPHEAAALPRFRQDATFRPGDDNLYRHRVALVGEILLANQLYSIATTHFTWGMSDEDHFTQADQLVSAATLIKQLQTYPDLVLTGDFNKNRWQSRTGERNPVYAAFCDELQLIDQIPAEITSTMDPTHFRHYQRLVVEAGLRIDSDWLLATAEYQVTKVKLVDNLSDHQAITAIIRRND